MKKVTALPFALAFFAFLALPSGALALSADEIVEKAYVAYYYGGDDGRARVKMTITSRSGRERVREMTILRKDVADGGEQRYYIYFHRPADVEGMVFMVWTHPGADDDRWLYLPAIDLVRRVASSDRRSSFAGSHFTYEDVSGRSPFEDLHTLKGEGEIAGRSAYIIENVPKDPSAVEFSRYTVWVDKENFIPMRGEYFDKGGRLMKTMTVEEVREVQGVPTVIRGRAVREDGGETVVEFTGVEYDLGLKEKIFTERYLTRPPRKYLK